ncbi:hypothetical protein K0U83_19705, partial [bacterium]|nr:hypothetical protein [bacterium]
MSRPRKPFGAQQPGRLPATMMKVLAAEMSDPQRLRRGKQYSKDGSVLDIVVDRGVVTCEVQGTRSTPYIAALEVTPGDGMPLRRDVRAVCNCPDDNNWDDHACKHVIAAMFVFADELLMEPGLLDAWRGRDETEPNHDTSADDDHDDDEVDDLLQRRRHLQLVRDGMEQGRSERRDQHQARREREPLADPIANILTIPEGAALPSIPHLERADELLPGGPDLAT